MKQLRKTELKRFLRKNKVEQKDIVLVLENIQYARNVAEMFRIADAFGIREIYLTGISHKPPFGKELQKVSRAKEMVAQWKYFDSTKKALNVVKGNGYKVVILEIADAATSIEEFKVETDEKIAIVVGNEAHGVNKETLQDAYKTIFIPMNGRGASLNVSVSLAILLGKIFF